MSVHLFVITANGLVIRRFCARVGEGECIFWRTSGSLRCFEYISGYSFRPAPHPPSTIHGGTGILKLRTSPDQLLLSSCQGSYTSRKSASLLLEKVFLKWAVGPRWHGVTRTCSRCKFTASPPSFVSHKPIMVWSLEYMYK